MKLTPNVENISDNQLSDNIVLTVCIRGFSALAAQNKSFGYLLKITHAYTPTQNIIIMCVCV